MIATALSGEYFCRDDPNPSRVPILYCLITNLLETGLPNSRAAGIKNWPQSKHGKYGTEKWHLLLQNVYIQLILADYIADLEVEIFCAAIFFQKFLLLGV